MQSIRDRTHWKSQEIRPRDPVLLGLCSQLELDEVVTRARMEQPPRGADRSGGAARRQPEPAAEVEVEVSE